jgi:hypothetical protein
LLKIAFIRGPAQDDIHNNMMTNSFNDLASENMRLMHLIKDNIITMLTSIVAENNLLLIITLGLLGVCMFITGFVTIKSYFDTCSFLCYIIDPTNEFMRNLILTNAPISQHYAKVHRKKLEKSSNDLNSFKSGQPDRTKLFRILLQRLAILLPLLVVPVGLLIKSNSLSNNNETEIRSTIGDLINMNELRMHALYVVSLSIIGVVYEPGKSLYTPNMDLFITETEMLGDLVSVSKGFSRKTLEYFSEDMCPFYLYHPIRPSCAPLGNGIGYQGIIASVLHEQTYMRQWVVDIKKANGDRTIIGNMFAAPEYLDHFYLTSNAISPAIEHF